MAYRSRRRPKRRRSSQRVGRIVIALLLLGLAVYFVTISAAGNWVAQNVVAPLFRAASPAPEATDGPALVLDEPAKTEQAGETQQVSMAAFTAYGLQMGAFSNESNAQNEADNLRARGAGGYVLHEGGHYRVLASAYETQEQIQKVRDQLKAENIDSGIYKIQTNAITLKITTSSAQLRVFKNAVESMATARKTLYEAFEALDSAAATMEQSIQTIRSLHDDLSSKKDALDEAAKGSQSLVLDALNQWYGFTLQALSALSENTSESALDFSSQMKYTHIAVICETRNFVERIESGAVS